MYNMSALREEEKENAYHYIWHPDKLLYFQELLQDRQTGGGEWEKEERDGDEKSQKDLGLEKRNKAPRTKSGRNRVKKKKTPFGQVKSELCYNQSV